VLPAATSTLVAGLVAATPVRSTVLALHRVALYLDVGGRVLPVVSADAVALPTAVRLAVPSRAVAWGVAAGDGVAVGGGRVALPAFDVVTARSWRPARVRRVEPRVGCSGGRLDSHLGTRPDGVARVLSSELWAQASQDGWLAEGIRAVVSGLGCSGGRQGSHPSTRLGEATAAVGALVGRGAGLTPSGDDALAGALLVAHAMVEGGALGDAVRARLGATTAVSAALLDAAADGYAAQPVVALVDAAVVGDADAVSRALPAVLAIGHTSGGDTVAGIRAALDALRPGDECSPGGRGDRFGTHSETTGWRAA
jgi:hypothetical protein